MESRVEVELVAVEPRLLGQHRVHVLVADHRHALDILIMIRNIMYTCNATIIPTKLIITHMISSIHLIFFVSMIYLAFNLSTFYIFLCLCLFIYLPIFLRKHLTW